MIFKTGTGKSVVYDEGYSTKKSSGLFSTSDQEKIVMAAGLDAGDGSAMMWRINSLSDLGAALRLCGPYGIISLRLIDKNIPETIPETENITFSGNNSMKRTFWY